MLIQNLRASPKQPFSLSTSALQGGAFVFCAVPAWPPTPFRGESLGVLRPGGGTPPRNARSLRARGRTHRPQPWQTARPHACQHFRRLRCHFTRPSLDLVLKRVFTPTVKFSDGKVICIELNCPQYFLVSMYVGAYANEQVILDSRIQYERDLARPVMRSSFQRGKDGMGPSFPRGHVIRILL